MDTGLHVQSHCRAWGCTSPSGRRVPSSQGSSEGAHGSRGGWVTTLRQLGEMNRASCNAQHLPEKLHQGPQRSRVDSPFARVHHHLLCRQGDHLDPVGPKAGSFCALDTPEFRHQHPLAPSPDRKAQLHPGVPAQGARRGNAFPRALVRAGLSTGPRAEAEQKQAEGKDRPGGGSWAVGTPNSAPSSTYRRAGFSRGTGISGKANGALKQSREASATFPECAGLKGLHPHGQPTPPTSLAPQGPPEQAAPPRASLCVRRATRGRRSPSGGLGGQPPDHTSAPGAAVTLILDPELQDSLLCRPS